MNILPNECIYEILVLLDPKKLLLCGQMNNNFYGLSQLASLWRNRIDGQYHVLFEKETWYETCKLYHQLDVLNGKLMLYNRLCDLYQTTIVSPYNLYGLKSVPDGLELLPRLESLTLSGTQLTDFSLKVPLTRLEYLYLKRNEFTYFPAEICHLTKLKALDLGYNKLTNIPKMISRLTNLSIIWLNDNKIANLPSYVKHLTNLVHLDCQNNKIKKIPAEINQFISLRYLMLNGNKLKNVPIEIKYMTNLFLLKIYNNQLTEKCIENLRKLINVRYLHLYAHEDIVD